MDLRTLMDRLGGRKFVAWVLATVSLVSLAAFGREPSAEVLSTVETLLGMYLAGNATTHIAGAIGRRSTEDSP